MLAKGVVFPTAPFKVTAPVVFVIIKAWAPLIVPENVKVPVPVLFLIVVSDAKLILPDTVAPVVKWELYTAPDKL